MEVEHFSHPDHPLILINQVFEYSCELVICSGCEGPIWGPCYSCTSCYFFLHKTCAELPREIKRRIHPRHPLHLLAKPPYLQLAKPQYNAECFCNRCDKSCKSFVYHCSFCDFDLDIKCAFQPGFLEVDSRAHQFVHKDHPLILNEEQDYHGEGVMCSVCKEPMSGPSYSCTSCNFFLHKKCAELPPEIKRHIHPEHPLRLLPNEDVICDFCNETCYESFVYCCFVCEFNLHIKCAFPPCVYAADQDKGHQFRRLLNSPSLKSISFTCNACGTDGDDSPLVCTMCQLLVHEECISLPGTLKTALHHHPRIIHTYHPQQCIESINKYCGICCREVDTEYGVYYCPDCDFVAHVNCSREYGDSATEIVEENEDRQIVAVDDQFMEPSFHVVREIKHGEERIIEEIEHLSHQHNLILIDKVDDDLKCDGCMLPVSTPFYSCVSCNFFLDRTCIELPRQKKWQYHENQLILSWNRGSHDLYTCVVCNQYFRGLSYTCAICRLSIDVRCFRSLNDSTKHGGHEHLLYLPADRKNILRCNIGGRRPPPWLANIRENIPHCSGCCVSEESKVFFKCVLCDFKLGMKCATLPYKARHEYDDHPLFLTYINENDYQPSCIICEKDRDPKLWFYRCEECDFDAHTECALGKYPYVKLGGVLTCPKHPHPLALVVKTEDHPACDTCGEPCDDFAIECTDPNCSFIVHRKRRQCFDSLWYTCDVCGLCIDVRCFKSLKDSFKHGGHEHPLYLPSGRKNILRCNIGGHWLPPLLADDGESIPHCSGCCVREESKVFLKCAVCDLKLGMKCATLPYKARHEYDDHPLFLTYINENDYQPSCIICEEDRDPKLWFYRCEQCDFDAHPECALGKYPYIKAGGVRTYSKHPHPLALVDKTGDYRPQACDSCGEPCDDLDLECTDPNCSLIVHGIRWECRMSLW